jgi:hypothetical protein
MALSGQALVNSTYHNVHIQLHEAVPLHDKLPSDILQIIAYQSSLPKGIEVAGAIGPGCNFESPSRLLRGGTPFFLAYDRSPQQHI